MIAIFASFRVFLWFFVEEKAEDPYLSKQKFFTLLLLVFYPLYWFFTPSSTVLPSFFIICISKVSCSVLYPAHFECLRHSVIAKYEDTTYQKEWAKNFWFEKYEPSAFSWTKKFNFGSKTRENRFCRKMRIFKIFDKKVKTSTFSSKILKIHIFQQNWFSQVFELISKFLAREKTEDSYFSNQTFLT